MRYFEIKQDIKLRNSIVFEGFEGCPNIVMDRERAQRYKRCVNMYVNGNQESQYPDIIQSPILLISEKLYQILQYYDKNVIYKMVILTDLKMRRQDPYRLMMPTEKEVDDEITKEDRIFYIKKDGKHHLIVNEDVLESILSRHCVGIVYQQVEDENSRIKIA